MNDRMARRVCFALLFGLSLAACSGAVPLTGTAQATRPGVTGSAFASLSQVPLKVPQSEPGQSCPLSKLSQLGPHLGNAMGSGPVYVFSGEIVGSGHGNKVAWGASPSYSGPIRIRGGRIDGSGQLLLEGPDNYWRGAPVKTIGGTHLYPELDFLESHSIFPNVPTGWRMWPSDTYVASPGCYAWQVDGDGFTELITFHSLDLPTLSAGAACPVSPQQVAHNLSAEFGDGPAVGAGPIYALMGEMQGGALPYSLSYSQSHPTDPWQSSKVLWMAKPEVGGTVLVRGRQIDAPIAGPNWILFGIGDAPEAALQWEIASQRGWASLPSEIRIRTPGCYAYQVDSQKGSEEIVFEVVGTQ
jgi:hypothetical protein